MQLIHNPAVWRFRRWLLNWYEIYSWSRAKGATGIPHVFKQALVLSYATKYGLRVFIETGTYMGDMVNAVRRGFDNIISIELSEQLCRRARHQFRASRHIKILQGDSGEVLPQVLTEIDNRCLFWLDGHYSGGVTAKGSKDTPILRELKAILNHRVKEHVVLIDDARCFNGSNDYPTLEEIRNFIESRGPEYDWSACGDVIRLEPKALRNLAQTTVP